MQPDTSEDDNQEDWPGLPGRSARKGVGLALSRLVSWMSFMLLSTIVACQASVSVPAMIAYGEGTFEEPRWTDFVLAGEAAICI